MNKILSAVIGCVALAGATPAVAAPLISLDETSFNSIRDVTMSTFNFAPPAGSASTDDDLGRSYVKDGVTFSANLDVLTGVYANAATGTPAHLDSRIPLNISFDGPVLGLWITSGRVQWLTAEFDGVTTRVLSKGQTIFFGFDKGEPGNVSATIKGLDLNVVKFETSVPEPATWAMMMLGFGMAAGALRRRRVATSVRFA